MASGTASVKAVLSGDTVVLVGKTAGNGPPQEITITLASLQAPRISRGPQQSTEDPSAFESREFLRKLCIGKTVTFKIVYCVTSINRTFGDIFFQNTSEDPDSQPVCLSELVVAAGWSPVRGTEGADKLSSRHETLIALEAEAKSAKRGVHGPKGAGRVISWAPTSTEVEEIFNKHKGVPTTAVVEYVRDGASLRVLLLDSMTYLSFSLAGIICPRINASKSQPAAADSDTPATANKPEPFALQARHFTELRLLNREVQIVMQTLDRTGNVLGSVLHPKGNIAVEMVKNGLAKVSDRSLAVLSKDTVLALRVVEKEAQLAQRFIWTNYQPAAPSACMCYFEGLVVEIVSGDTIVVQEGDEVDGAERKITLSSIKVPRLGNIKGDGMEPWALESRDLLRSRLVGKKVGVSVEYEKVQASGSQPGATQKRVFATVKVLSGKETQGQGKNVALMLVMEGVATCVKHREGEDRSGEYDSYLMAEAEAAAKSAGLHGAGPAPSTLTASSLSKIQDLTAGVESKKAKAAITLMMQRNSTGSSSGMTVRGSIEFVYSGSRVKILIPSENCVLQLTLNQLRCPLPSRGASASAGAARLAEPFAEEAKRFTRRNLMHRQVEVCIDDSDKNGVALGRIYVLPEPTNSRGKGGSKSPYALTLVAAGLARVDTRFASEKPSSEISELQDAQALALVEQKAMWSIPETVAEEEMRQSGGGRGNNNADEFNGEGEGDDADIDIGGLAISVGGKKGPSLRGEEERVTVRLCEITDGVTFFVHVASEARQKQLQAVEQQMAAYAAAHVAPVLGTPEEPVAKVEAKKGQLVLALFDEKSGSGPVWFRAKVEEVETGGKRAKVQFIDYGNRAVVLMTEIAILDSPSSSSASKSPYFSVPPLAIECSLAFLSPPSYAEEVGNEGLIRAAGLSLGDLTWDRDLSMQVLGREYSSGKLLVALFEEKASDDEESNAGEKEEESENVFDGEGEESRKRRAALALANRALSVNELVLMDGLARISRSATRMLPRGGARLPTPPQSGNKRDKAPLSLTPLASALLVHMEVAQAYAKRAHTNLFRYGDPADSDEERENDREKEREKKDRDSKSK